MKAHGEYPLPRKALKLTFAFLLVFSVLLVFPLSLEQTYGQSNVIQQNNFQVRNLDTGESFSTIQGAIDASDTLDGHVIFVASGIYYEHVTVSKSLSLIGEDSSTTIIDGNGMGNVVYVTADNVEVRNFTIRNGSFGLWLEYSQNSKIVGNTLHDGSYGIRLRYSRNSEIVGNNVYGFTWFGFQIKSSGNTTLRDNIMADNTYNFGVNGDLLFDFINDIDVSNTVNGKPIRYLINQQNITIDSFTFEELGYLGVVNSSNIEVENLNVQNNVQGMLFAFTTNSTISNVNAKNNWNGIYVAHSSNVSVSGNNANSNFDYGIKFFNSSRSVARGNNLDNNGWAGLGLFGSPNSTVDGNEANFNSYGLHIVYTNSSVITRNGALINPGAYSIAVYYSHNNVIYHNAFVNSDLYVETRNRTRVTPRNTWDNGLEGNYWSSYGGADADEDGIADTPYRVGNDNVDDFPLMGKFSDFTVTSGGKIYSIGVISSSAISQFQFSPDDGIMSFMATGEKGTEGFSRISVPNAFILGLQGGNLSFLINGEQPVLKNGWTDENHTYFYFSYANSVYELAISPWLIIVVASVFLIISVIAILYFWKRRGIRSRLSREKVPDDTSKNPKDSAEVPSCARVTVSMESLLYTFILSYS